MEQIELAIRVPPSRSSLHLATKDEVSIATVDTSGPLFEALNPDVSRHENAPYPVDGGFAAWSFLVAAFLVEILIWGFPNSFGSLLVAYLDDPLYSSQPHATTILPLVGTLCTGIMYCSGLVVYPTIQLYPRVRRYYTWIGTLVCSVSLVGASFTTEVTTLVALQGVLFALGGSLAYAPVLSYLSEWFVRRRGLANGIIFAGANAGGIIFPLILPPLISRFGLMQTTRIYAVALALCMVPALLFMKARLPESRVHGPAPRASTNNMWLKDRRFWFFMTINTIQGLGHFVPLIWLPTYASSLGLSNSQSSLALTLVNAASMFSSSAMGFMSDRFNIWVLALSSLVCTSLVTFILWGVFSYSLAGILIYGIAYGCTAGAWSSMWSGFVKPIAKDDSSLATTLFSFFLLSRGLGNILSTPISTALQHAHRQSATDAAHTAHKSGFTVADGRYHDMIVYTGSCFAGAAVIAVVGWSLERRNQH